MFGLTGVMLIQSCSAVMVVVSFVRAHHAQLNGESAIFPPYSAYSAASGRSLPRSGVRSARHASWARCVLAHPSGYTPILETIE
uniref:Uncharacterized protein n=1 Tax=Mycolicibacterium gilvum (strain PYR-GCK) TaxID=350054 RepID=A4TBZ8_MYCGI|nr:hypothetical protein Mflv_3726 [Mycolicibacterium gilvum PYR-GCK]